MKRSSKRARIKYSTIYPVATFSLVVIVTFGLIYSTSSTLRSNLFNSRRSQIKYDEPLNPPFDKTANQITKTQVAVNNSQSEKPDNSIPPIVNGLAPVIDSIDTKEKVVFLGIDDGANKQNFELNMMKVNNIKASLFLSDIFIENNPTFFKQFIPEGSLIEDHTMNHLPMNTLSYDQQKQEICNEADLFQQYYGRRPIIFRPPGGSYNTNTQRAAADCGMKAVVLWVAKANGGSMQYQIGNSLRPGDIVLMHFRPEFKSDMQAFLDAEHTAGLHTELLENWLQ